MKIISSSSVPFECIQEQWALSIDVSETLIECAVRTSHTKKLPEQMIKTKTIRSI